MLPTCSQKNLHDDSKLTSAAMTTMPSFLSQTTKSTTTMVSTSEKKPSRTFDFDLTSIPPESNSNSPEIEPSLMPQLAPFAPTSMNKKGELRIELPIQPTLVVQSPKTPTLSRKLKAMSLDSDSNASESPGECLEVPRDTFSMPNTPKRQLSKSIQKFGVRSHSGTSLGLDVGSNLSSFGSNQSISGSQTLKTLPEVMTLSDFSQVKIEPIRIRAKGLLERRGSNVSLTIDLCAAEAKNNNYRLNTARSVSNLNLTTIGNDKCKCKTETKCDCMPKRKDCKKCLGNLKKFQKLSTESCLCDETTNNVNCQGYKVCQYSRLGCLNYLSYMRRKSLSNENLYIGPSYEYKKAQRKSEYPKHATASQFKNQILSEDFQLHLQNIQYLQTAGNVLSKKQLKECCKIENLKDLHKEFWELPQNFQEKSFVSGSQSKNRYKTILPNEHSRVVLDLGPGQDSSGSEGYINANYIKGFDYTETAYIATQGPLPHTTEDLWHMVLQSNVQKVVMLTPIQEKGRVKCEIYFPEKLHDSLSCGKFQIKCLYIHKEKSYTIRTLRIRDTSKPLKPNTPKVKQVTTVENILNSPKFCCDKMKQCGIECKKLTKTFTNQTISNESNQNSPNHIISPLVKNNNNRNNLFNFDEDDIFTNIEYKPNRPRLRSRDCKFSDDFTDVLDLNLQNDDSEEELVLESDRVVQHYWYQTWPDHNLASTEEILALALDVLDSREDAEQLFEMNRPSHLIKLHNKTCTNEQTVVNCQRNLASNSKGKSEFRMHIDKLKEGRRAQKTGEKITVPIVVHCSAGIGRTGCFLAILNGIQQLKQNANVDVLAIVCALRLNRGGMVQTAEQYELVHKVLALYGELVEN